MIDTMKLKGVIVQNGKTQEDVARHLGMSPKTFYAKVKKQRFQSDEIESMIEYLNIDDPLAIFFAGKVTSQDTKTED